MHKPLAEILRPTELENFLGQKHLLEENATLYEIFHSEKPVSLILWGPPGCGKTTLANIIVHHFNLDYEKISATTSGIADVKKVIEKAKLNFEKTSKPTLLFIDEIHRFNKLQQDAFLAHVENGTLILIGATTENPSFSVNNALISRVRILKFENLSSEDIEKLILKTSQKFGITIGKNVSKIISEYSGGDARKALNTLEIFLNTGKDRIEEAELVKILKGEVNTSYDKTGDYHYDLISAFHKSLRGSDPDAACYWMFRMLDGGEDPLYIVRRMVRFASEDIGLADPHALTLAVSTLDTVKFLGMPEADNAMTVLAVYLALAPKSNSAYIMTKKVKDIVKKYDKCKVPLHLRNAPTNLMKEIGYGKEYKYPHDYKDGFIPQQYMPDELNGKSWYEPKERGKEKKLKEIYQWILNKKRG
ncbi:MAG: replication-associated recombination protein A [Candidatus Muiribacteriota bacterium]